MIEYPPYSCDLSMQYFCLFFNLKELCGYRFNFEDEIDGTINHIFYLFQEIEVLGHLIYVKFAYKCTLILVTSLSIVSLFHTI